MSVLTALLTHLPAPEVRCQMDYLRALCPEARFVVCHGGQKADHVALNDPDALFLDDPSLRGPHFDQSLNHTLRVICERLVAGDPVVEWLYLLEYDQLILRPDFDRRLIELANQTGADLLGKGAGRRNDSNWPHLLRVKHDRRLAEYIGSISTRDEPGDRYGSLGTGMFISRRALSAFCDLVAPPDYYFEMFVPTVIHHLGFRVVDVDAHSDLYRHIRWLPEFTVADATACCTAGASFVHPFKRIDQLSSIAAASGSGVKASVATKSG